jgi:hypothetical protein
MRTLQIDFTQEKALVVVLAAISAGDQPLSVALSAEEKEACEEILEQLDGDSR